MTGEELLSQIPVRQRVVDLDQRVRDLGAFIVRARGTLPHVRQRSEAGEVDELGYRLGDVMLKLEADVAKTDFLRRSQPQAPPATEDVANRPLTRPRTHRHIEYPASSESASVNHPLPHSRFPTVAPGVT
jgi:hypothetical protein